MDVTRGPFVNKGGILPLAVPDGGTGASGARYCSYEQLIVAVDFEGVELNRHGPLCLVQMILGAVKNLDWEFDMLI